VLAISGSPEVQKQAAQIYARDKVPARSSAAAIPRRPARQDSHRLFLRGLSQSRHSYLMAELSSGTIAANLKSWDSPWPAETR